MLGSNKNQFGYIAHGLLLGLVCLVVFGVFSLVHSVKGQAITGEQISSGIAGYCLGLNSSDQAIATDCNDGSTRGWIVNGSSLQQGQNCLSVINDSASVGSTITLKQCQSLPGQVWLKTGDSLLNPNSQLCLSLPEGKLDSPLIVAACSRFDPKGEQWFNQGKPASCNSGDEGQKVACYATTDWSDWNANSADHMSLLNSYTDGAPYEEWCADFVSYVYKQAGHPFTGGESDGWDENNANNIANFNFTTHDPSNYTPKVGDVAYFNYTGGHVEIVISGGKKPTFIYGNSATVDPSTGNGEMAANTKVSDGDRGNLVYYLSP